MKAKRVFISKQGYSSGYFGNHRADTCDIMTPISIMVIWPHSQPDSSEDSLLWSLNPVAQQQPLHSLKNVSNSLSHSNEPGADVSCAAFKAYLSRYGIRYTKPNASIKPTHGNMDCLKRLHCWVIEMYRPGLSGYNGRGSRRSY